MLDPINPETPNTFATKHELYMLFMISFLCSYLDADLTNTLQIVTKRASEFKLGKPQPASDTGTGPTHYSFHLF